MMISSPHRLSSPGTYNFTVTISSPKSLSSSLHPDDFIVKLSLPHPPRPPRPSDLNLTISLPHPPEPEDLILTISSFFSCTPGLYPDNILVVLLKHNDCPQWIEWPMSSSSFLFLTGDVAFTRCCSWLRESPSPTRSFIGSDPLYKWRTARGNLPRRSRCCVVFASSRNGPGLPFSLSKFFDWTNTYRCFYNPPVDDPTRMANSHSIRRADWRTPQAIVLPGLGCHLMILAPLLLQYIFSCFASYSICI